MKLCRDITYSVLAIGNIPDHYTMIAELYEIACTFAKATDEGIVVQVVENIPVGLNGGSNPLRADFTEDIKRLKEVWQAIAVPLEGHAREFVRHVSYVIARLIRVISFRLLIIFKIVADL